MSKIFSVSEINKYVSGLIKEDFLLGREISVSGEVTNCTNHPTGIYFTIKDDLSKLSCVVLNRIRNLNNISIENGKKVILKGHIDLYLRNGSFQMQVTSVEEKGTGDKYADYLKLKEKLMDMGMFDEIYKKPLPKYAMCVGIVTASASSGGAASGDIVQAALKRNPYIQLVQYSSRVQGQNAEYSIANGIEVLDNYGVDVIIVGRGGGSLDDLSAYNTEAVARAIFNCTTPVISAVGHNINEPISDLVADAAAITPTAAAALAVFSYDEFSSQMNDIDTKLRKLMNSRIRDYKTKLSDYDWKINKLSPESKLKSREEKIDLISHKMLQVLINKIEQRRNKLDIFSEKLHGMSPLNKLSGGYAYVSRLDGRSVKNIDDVNSDDILDIYLMDGRIKAKVIEKEHIDNKI